MKKAIVCTTINPPTEALEKFRAMEGWRLIVVGDHKTPHEAYTGWDYLDPFYQHSRWPVLSNLIGWDCIQRRNFGFIEAYQWGAEVVATVDDDNIPSLSWGENLSIGKSFVADEWKTSQPVFDPLTATNQSHLWHRGFPLPLLAERERATQPWCDREVVAPDIQADLWHGDPDVDAIARLVWQPEVEFDTVDFFFSRTISPFNSQNTFISRRFLPEYFMYPGVGRFDDIWAAYHVQQTGAQVVYGPPSVYQRRNPHNLVADLKAEMYGYEHTLDFIAGLPVLPERAQAAFREYQCILAG